ncbi:MAG: DUF4389 domain-containing protein [Burkholderiaceae bacterium]
MTENDVTITGRRSIWVRALYMLLMGLILQLCGTLLCALTLVQFVLVLLTETPNARLIAFSRSLGRYVQQIVWFIAFASEDLPFPFADWPSSE